MVGDKQQRTPVANPVIYRGDFRLRESRLVVGIVRSAWESHDQHRRACQALLREYPPRNAQLVTVACDEARQWPVSATCRMAVQVTFVVKYQRSAALVSRVSHPRPETGVVPPVRPPHQESP